MKAKSIEHPPSTPVWGRNPFKWVVLLAAKIKEIAINIFRRIYPSTTQAPLHNPSVQQIPPATSIELPPHLASKLPLTPPPLNTSLPTSDATASHTPTTSLQDTTPPDLTQEPSQSISAPTTNSPPLSSTPDGVSTIVDIESLEIEKPQQFPIETLTPLLARCCGVDESLKLFQFNQFLKTNGEKPLKLTKKSDSQVIFEVQVTPEKESSEVIIPIQAIVTKERCERIRNPWIKQAATMFLRGQKQKTINFNSTIKKSPITGLIDFEKRLVQFDSPIESIIPIILGVHYSSSVTGVQSVQDPTIQDLAVKKAPSLYTHIQLLGEHKCLGRSIGAYKATDKKKLEDLLDTIRLPYE